jgi:flagellar hook-associated protein 1
MPDFTALHTAYTALSSHRRRIDVAGQNIANVDTPGYTRLRAELTNKVGNSATGLFSGPAFPLGVDVSSISRLRDEALDQQARGASSRSGFLSEQTRALSLVEERLGGLGEGSLSAQLTALWGGFADLANDPGSSTARHVVIQRASQVAATTNELATGVVAQHDAEFDRLQALVREVNDLAHGIAALRPGIIAAHASGEPAHELLDQQDRLLDRLAELVGVQAVRRPDSSVDVYLDGHNLVSDGAVKPLEATRSTPVDVHGFARVEVRAGSGGRALEVRTGSVGGLVTVVNHALPDQLARLDEVARAIADTVNTIHTQGRGLLDATSRNLFRLDGPNGAARHLQVEPDLLAEPDHLAAAGGSEGRFGASIAWELARIGDTATDPSRAFDRLVGEVGARVAALRTSHEAAAATTAQARSARESVTGVSLDEELTNLVESQRAYEAAARLLTTIDQLLDTLINRTGLVGR